MEKNQKGTLKYYETDDLHGFDLEEEEDQNSNPLSPEKQNVESDDNGSIYVPGSYEDSENEVPDSATKDTRMEKKKKTQSIKTKRGRKKTTIEPAEKESPLTKKAKKKEKQISNASSSQDSVLKDLRKWINEKKAFIVPINKKSPVWEYFCNITVNGKMLSYIFCKLCLENSRVAIKA